MSKTHLLAAALTLLLLDLSFAIPQTAPDTAPPNRNRPRPRPWSRPGGGGGRGPTTGPGMVQDPVTSQWYTPMSRPAETTRGGFAFGGDLSSTFQLEQQGRTFKDTDGQTKPILQLLKSHGYNWVRLRTCVEPATLPQNTAYTVAAAKQAKALGYQVLLDFHYSNGWADPTNEPTPRNWQNLSHPDLIKTLFEYTRDTTAAFAKENVLPDIIQVGNEVSNGFLWPNAHLPDKWDDFADLIYAGINGIDAGRGNNKRPKIMIHVDHGGDIVKTKAFFDKFNTYDIPFDMIGFSFYPWSHGTLIDLKANFAFTANAYHKDIMLVETGYYYQPSQYFRTTPGPFPESPEGQAQWLDALTKIVMDTPEGHGKGIFWWEPAASGGLTARGYFDQQGAAQPILNVFHPYTRPLHRTDNQ